jgi:hypothetical protein
VPIRDLWPRLRDDPKATATALVNAARSRARGAARTALTDLLKQPARPATQHSIGGADTCWVFACATMEGRHIDDVVFCADVLRKKGVLDANILVFTDHPAADAHFGPYGLRNVHALTNLNAVLSRTHARYVVAVCGGHGSHLGLQAGANPATSPHQLMSSMRVVRNAEVAVVFLCQCYAGVFHYIDATSVDPKVVVVGSTMFYPTLSHLVHLAAPIQTTTGLAGLRSWGANLYQLSLFEWLRAPRDVDGDGRVDLLDAYKFAGATTVAQIGSIWVDVLGELRNQQEELELAEQALADGDPLMTQMRVDAHRSIVAQQIQILYTIQEPWLLNARLASQVHFV